MEFIKQHLTHAVFTYGHFNPPSAADEAALSPIDKYEGDRVVFLSGKKGGGFQMPCRTVWFEAAFPHVMWSTRAGDPFKALGFLIEQGYSSVTAVFPERYHSRFASMEKYALNGKDGKPGVKQFQMVWVEDSFSTAATGAHLIDAAVTDRQDDFFSAVPSRLNKDADYYKAVQEGVRNAAVDAQSQRPS